MFLSVIVPTCNRYAQLSQCLTALSPQRQGVASGTYEIIVTDDSSTDEQKLRLANDFPEVQWNQGPRRGPASNRNSGAKASKGDWLVFLDDDCVPQATLLAAYVEAISKNPQIRVFEGATLEERPQRRMDEEAPINETGGYLWSCNFMIQRQLFFELDGFCELFPYAALEDVDLRERLKKKGNSLLFAPKASVIHPWRMIRSHFRYIKIQLYSHEIYYMRHPEMIPSLPGLAVNFCRTIYRDLFLDGPELRFRGVVNWMLRTSSNSIVLVFSKIKSSLTSNRPKRF